MGKGSGAGSGAHVQTHVPSTPVRAQHSGSTAASPLFSFKSRSPSTKCPKGLTNVGNTCYANAALQCLLSTALTQVLLHPEAVAIFRRYSSNPNLLKRANHKTNKQQQDRKLLETCRWLTKELTVITQAYEEEDDGFFWKSTVNPGSITLHPNRLSQCLRPYQQEDAHEFLRALLSTLVMNGQNKQLSSLFDGLLESAVTCQSCHRASLTRDRYMDLSLDISAPHITNLQDALREFTKTELLDHDNTVFCEYCQCKTQVTKGLRLATAPTILVCHLKRFAWDPYGRLRRIGKPIPFEETLQIGDCMSRVNKSRPPPYELVAVLVHQGRTCESGHYLAYVKRQGDWFQCNDSVVTQVDASLVHRQEAYMLLYEVADMRKKHGYDGPHPSLRRPTRHNMVDRLVQRAEQLNEKVVRDFCCYFCQDTAPTVLEPQDEDDVTWASTLDSSMDNETVTTAATTASRRMRKSNSSGNLKTLVEQPPAPPRRPVRMHSFASSDPGNNLVEVATPPRRSRRNSSCSNVARELASYNTTASQLPSSYNTTAPSQLASYTPSARELPPLAARELPPLPGRAKPITTRSSGY